MYTGLIKILEDVKISEYVCPGETYYVRPKTNNIYYIKYVANDEDTSPEALDKDLSGWISGAHDGSMVHEVRRAKMRVLFSTTKIKIIT